MTRLYARLGGAPGMLVGAACLAVLAMYCTNRDMGGDPVTPRGDGVYRPVLARGDGHMMYLMARSTALDLDWSFDDDLARFGDPFGPVDREPRTKTGHIPMYQSIGAPLVWTPLIWIAEAGALVANVFGADIPLHGYTLWHQRFVFLSSVVFACGAVLLGLRLARRAGLGRWAPAYAATAVLLGTSLTYYATDMPSYSHAMDAFACAAFLAYWAATLGRSDRRRWLALGALLGVAGLARAQELAMGIVIAVEIAFAIAGDVRRRAVDWRMRALIWLGGGGLALIVALVVFAPQLYEWHVVFGDAFAVPQGPRFSRPGSPMVLELLFSPRNGWLSSAPIAYAGVIGLCCLPRRRRVLAAGLGAAVAIQVYIASTIFNWWSDASFGQRRLCDLSLPVVVGLAALLWRCGRLARRMRAPRSLVHLTCVVPLGLALSWNLGRVASLRGGKAPGNIRETSCCERFVPAFRPIAQWVYDRIGDPFELPASAIFAIRHGVSLRRWDELSGDYPLEPEFRQIHDDRLVHAKGEIQVGWPEAARYLVGGWTAPHHAGRPSRATTAPGATVLVPNLVPCDQQITAVLSAPGQQVTLRWDGDAVATATLGASWTPVRFVVHAMSVGTHELAIDPPGIAAATIQLEIVGD